jgi:hypothetical protein
MAVVDGKKQRATEGSDKIAEVSPSEFPLARCAEPDDAGVLGQDPHRKHVAEHRVAHVHRDRLRRITQPNIYVGSSDATLLQRERHHLLSEDMCWQGGRYDWFNCPLAPQRCDCKRGQEFGVVGRKEETIARGPRPSPCSSHPLEERGHRRRRTNLHHSIEVSDVETELEGRGCDDGAIRLRSEGGLCLATLVDR